MSLFETIKYKVIKKDKNIELREYDNFILASTKTMKNPNQDSGFNNVFQYISGQNSKKEKISMTTPVVTYEDDSSLVTGFYVPSKYEKSNVPKPVSDRVFLNEFKKSLYAVIRFNGRWNDENFDKHNEILLDYINSNNLVVKSQRLVLRYQPPFVPSILRHNEIAYQVEISNSEGGAEND
jgi:hypothetical protein